MEPSQHIVTLASLRRLRWLTLAVLVLLSVATQLGWGPEASPAGIAGVLAVLFGAQLALWWWPEGRAGRHAATAVLTLDGLCLTTAFALTDGSATPYAFLYLFPVVLAGLVLPGWRSILVLAACTVGYASLFVIAPANLHHHDHQAMLTHMYGMFVAYTLTAVLIVAAMARMGRAQAAATEALMRAQDLQARTERVGSLATLAAGASHELANPLSTILMVASELRHKAIDDGMRQDLDLIGDEVARCRDILGALSAETAAGAGQGAQAIATSSLATGAVEASPDVVVDADDSTVVVPVTLVHQVIRRLVENARQAGSRHIVLTARGTGGRLDVSVRDDGAGMDAATRQRASEPFFTTRANGTGLGLFFASQVVQQLGGSLHITSSVAEGTTVRFDVPPPDAEAA